MRDLYRMRDIRPLEHIDGDGLLLPWSSGMADVRAQLNKEKTGLPGLRAPMGDFGKAPNFLEHFHYSHFRSHNIHSRQNDRRSRAIESAVQTSEVRDAGLGLIRGSNCRDRVQHSRFLNLRHVETISSELRMAETTQMRFAPAVRMSRMLSKLMPPIANQGTVTFAAAQRT